MIGKTLVRTALLSAVGATCAHAELPVEEIRTQTLAANVPYRFFVSDFSPAHMADNKLFVVNGTTMKIEAVLSSGSYFAQTALSPDHSEIYTASAYYSRLNRGDRQAYLVIYDAHTGKIKDEFPYPAKHAMAVPYAPTLRGNPDGKLIYVQNASPATSISVVDRASGKMVVEVPTPGCYALYPAASANRVSTLCGDGTMLTLVFDEKGNLVRKTRSEKFFNVDDDALFVSATRHGDVYNFISFKGNVVPVDVSGETAKPQAPWPLVTAQDKKRNWRPSGFQLSALHDASGTLYVQMHSNGREGSHKNPAEEIWVFDLASKKLVSKVKAEGSGGLAVSQGDHPRLFALNPEHRSIVAYDGVRKLRKVLAREDLGEGPTQIEAN